MLSEFVTVFAKFGFIIRAMGEPIMTAGFGLIIYNVITTESIFSKMLATKWMVFIGKISYSFYLWHWLIFSFVGDSVLQFTNTTNSSFYIAFILSALAIIPFAWLSYWLLEMPYFKKGKKSYTPAISPVTESI